MGARRSLGKRRRSEGGEVELDASSPGGSAVGTGGFEGDLVGGGTAAEDAAGGLTGLVLRDGREGELGGHPRSEAVGGSFTGEGLHDVGYRAHTVKGGEFEEGDAGVESGVDENVRIPVDLRDGGLHDALVEQGEAGVLVGASPIISREVSSVFIGRR